MAASIAHSSVYGQRPPLPTASPEDESPTDDGGTLSDEEDARAVLEPAMSPVATRLTTLHTPAIDSVSKSQAPRTLDYFGGIVPRAEVEDNDDYDDNQDSDGGDTENDTTPQAKSPIVEQSHQRGGHEQTAPTTSSPPIAAQPSASPSRSQNARSLLGSAFGPTRHQRSRSVGQEALKKLQKALPSLGSSTHFLPSLSTSLRFNDSKTSHSTSPKAKPSTPSTQNSETAQSGSNSTTPPTGKIPAEKSLSSHPLHSQRTSNARPLALRRVTSDESLLYHSLSRTSSLGDDNRFHDVREMVNMRFMALKDSLPEVPSFKLPSLPKRSQLSLNNLFSSEPVMEQQSRAVPDHQVLTEKSKDHSATLDRVLESLTGDIVILGGYRGSVLRSAEPPHHQLWAPVKLGLNMRKANLEVGLDDAAEESMPEHIIPSGMLKNIGPIDVSRKFFKKLRSCENARAGKLRVWDFGYDWRLGPPRLSQTLQDFLAKLPSNQPGVAVEERGAIVIAHSLGGLITRHAVNQRPELFAGVLYAGVPQRCVNILGPLRNGDAVLFNEKLLTAKVNFSIRTSFALLPDDGYCFVDMTTGEEYPVDFFNADDWVKWRLSPCVAAPLPPYNKPQSTPPRFPASFLRSRSDSKGDKKVPSEPDALATAGMTNGGTSAASLPHDEDDPLLKLSKEARDSAAPALLPSSELQRNYEYLSRTLAMTKKFRSELAHSPTHQDANAYPPLAIIYGKKIPTVYGAGVYGREAIPCSDAYDNLLFRSGDGVVLAKEAMLPPGYSLVRGGRVSSERGHITLLGDMPALGRALDALIRGRQKGIGHGSQYTRGGKAI